MGILKNGVSWRGFKVSAIFNMCRRRCPNFNPPVSAIFALGFYTNDALTPNRKGLIKEAKQTLAKTKSLTAEAKSFEEMRRDDLAEVKAMKKPLDELLQKYRARLAELEIEKGDGR